MLTRFIPRNRSRLSADWSADSLSVQTRLYITLRILLPSAKMRDENALKRAATITKEFNLLILSQKMEPINCRALWEPISCQELPLKIAGDNLRRNLG